MDEKMDEEIIPPATSSSWSWNDLSVTTWTNRTGLRARSFARSKAGSTEIHCHRRGLRERHHDGGQPGHEHAERAMFTPNCERSNKEVLKRANPSRLEHFG